jgi:glutathione S-transferase
MDVYFSPFACSMASRIALYEAGAQARFIEVDLKTKRTLSGEDFFAVNPLGQVPALRNDDGVVLTQNPAVLQYIAERFPAAGLAPQGGLERLRLQQWLCFTGTELHKAIFSPFFDPAVPDEAKGRAFEKGNLRLEYLNSHLTGREFLLDTFSVADAYLFTVLNWFMVTPIDLKKWPAIFGYYKRLSERPAIARAFAEEQALYAEAQARSGQ